MTDTAASPLDRLQLALGDRYRVEGEIGAGGMATVYGAQDTRHARRVAIKVLRPELASTLGAERFLREIAIAARLQHPHILGLLDSGGANGLLYYVMPFVDGASLRVKLRREGELPLDVGVRLLQQVLDALAYAHSEGIVHRDIKPENVMLSGSASRAGNRWHALVADFGVAKAVSEAAEVTSLTATGLAIGTPTYMAPEQAAADPHVDHRADIYAAGVLAYEIFSGAPPFGGASPQHVIAAHMTRTPESISKQRPAVPAELDELILRALEKRPADRWQTADEMLSRLQMLVTPVPGTRPARTQPVQKTFHLSENVCRRLDRAALDPRIIGSDMQFLDNEVRSDTLVFLIHGTGQDASVFRDLMSEAPYRCIAPTLLGMEPQARSRVAVPLRIHLELLREQLRAAIRETNPSHIVLVGFSSGGDFALWLVAQPNDDLRVDGILSLAGNLALETCFVTRVFMKLGSVSEAELLEGLQRFGNDSRTLEEWLKVHEYLVGTFRKFGTDLGPVRRFSSEYARSYEENADLFVEDFRAAAARVPIVRCVFEDAPTCRRILQEIRLRNVDDPTVLGDRYREDALAIGEGTGHFDFLRPDVFRRRLEDVVAAARAAAPR